ncbi:MAG: barstar family protein [Candidatus Kapaibacterium sp.]
MQTVKIETRLISDWKSFHDLFRNILGFPEFYGENMDAWVDCLTYIDEPVGMTSLTVARGELLLMEIVEASEFSKRCADQFQALIECTAFVNKRRVDIGGNPVLALLLL